METSVSIAAPVRFSKYVTSAAKGIAIMLMLFHHLFICAPSFVQQYGVTSLFVSSETIMAISNFGKVCVAVFVVLSAYGITISLDNNKNSLKTCVMRRFWKLESNFWFVFVIALATCFLRQDRLSVYFVKGHLNGIVYIVMDGLGLYHFFDTPTYNETWWYMSLAIFMIFLIPILVMIYNKVDICLVGVIALVPYLNLPYNAVSEYLFCMVLGIWLAKGEFFDTIRKRADTTLRRMIFLLLMPILIVVLAVLRTKGSFAYWADALTALCILSFLFVLMDEMKARLPVLTFIGKHATNIFLIHTLIFEYYFTDFIYKPKNCFLIFALLLITSLAASVVIEALKSLFFRWIGKRPTLSAASR